MECKYCWICFCGDAVLGNVDNSKIETNKQKITSRIRDPHPKITIP